MLVSISIAFKMAPIKQSKLKVKESIIEFYKLHSKKGHGFTYNQWKWCDLSEITIYRLLEKFDKEGTIERKPGSGKSPKLWKMDNQVLLNSKYLVCNLFLVRKLDKSMIKQHYSIWLSNSSHHPLLFRSPESTMVGFHDFVGVGIGPVQKKIGF